MPAIVPVRIEHATPLRLQARLLRHGGSEFLWGAIDIPPEQAHRYRWIAEGVADGSRSAFSIGFEGIASQGEEGCHGERFDFFAAARATELSLCREPARINCRCWVETGDPASPRLTMADSHVASIRDLYARDTYPQEWSTAHYARDYRSFVANDFRRSDASVFNPPLDSGRPADPRWSRPGALRRVGLSARPVGSARLRGADE